MTINFYQSFPANGVVFGGDGTTGAGTGLLLDSNFVLGTSGDCVGIRFVAPAGGVHIHSVYCFLHAANATSHDLTCALTAYNSANSTRADTTAIRSVTAAGGTAANKWLKFDFSAYSDSLTAGSLYWVVIGDIAGSGSAYSVRTRTNAITGVDITIFRKLFSLYTSADGFATAGTVGSPSHVCVIVFSDGSAVGVPYTQVLTSTDNTIERGMKFIFDEKITCAGMTFYGSSTNISTVQVLENATAPGGSVWSGFNGGNVYTPSVGEKTVGVIQFPSPVTFQKNTYYRITFRSSGVHIYPGFSEIQDFATLETGALKTLIGAGSWCYTIDNGAGGWTDYNNDTDGYRLARMSLILKQQEVITSSAGGVYTFGG